MTPLRSPRRPEGGSVARDVWTLGLPVAMVCVALSITRLAAQPSDPPADEPESATSVQGLPQGTSAGDSGSSDVDLRPGLDDAGPAGLPCWRTKPFGRLFRDPRDFPVSSWPL